MPPASSPPPEFSRPFALGRLTSAGLTVEVTAAPAERERVARRLGVAGLAALGARWELRRLSGGAVEANGHLLARLTQECVVTLDPFETEVDEHFIVRFIPRSDSEDDAVVDPDAIDELPYDDARIDLGEAAVEQLALGLDQFPRKPGATLPDTEKGKPGPEPDASDDAHIHPFAALAAKRGTP